MIRFIAITGGALLLLASTVSAQEAHLGLTSKKRPVAAPPAPDMPAAVRDADDAVQEYEELVTRDRIIKEWQAHERWRDLDALITQARQVLGIQRALRR